MRSLAPGTVIHRRYRVVSLAGRGGMGAVYAAHDLSLRATVALKQTRAVDEGLRRAFAREARLLAGLRHPCLPQVLDHFEEGGEQFLVMEYVPGEDLGALVARSPGGLPVADVLRWADELLGCLAHLHGQEPPVVHRDIKPANLKAGPGGLRLLDFGLAKGAGGGETRLLTGASVRGYTPHYAPLEQIQGSGTGVRADIYALGATLYHLLAGRHPADALARGVARLDGEADPLEPIGAQRPDLPPAVADLIMGALALRAADRPASAAELRAALRAAAGSLAPSPQIAAPPAAPAAPPARRRRPLGLVLLLALALALLAGWGWAATPAPAAPAASPTLAASPTPPPPSPTPAPPTTTPAPTASATPARAADPTGLALTAEADAPPTPAPSATPAPTDAPAPPTATRAPAPRPAATRAPTAAPAPTSPPLPVPIIPGAP